MLQIGPRERERERERRQGIGDRGPNGLEGTGRTGKRKNPRIGDKVQRTEGKGAEDCFEHKATNWLGPDGEQGVRYTGMTGVLRVGWGCGLARGKGRVHPGEAPVAGGAERNGLGGTGTVVAQRTRSCLGQSQVVPSPRPQEGGRGTESSGPKDSGK